MTPRSARTVSFSSFLYSSLDHRDLHSFPTRRSSDLGVRRRRREAALRREPPRRARGRRHPGARAAARARDRDRKSTRLNSSHVRISYAVFCLKKKKNHLNDNQISVQTHLTYLLSHTD